MMCYYLNVQFQGQTFNVQIRGSVARFSSPLQTANLTLRCVTMVC